MIRQLIGKPPLEFNTIVQPHENHPIVTSDSVETTPRKFAIVPYTRPVRTDMAVVIVFYNWVRSIRIVQNLLLVKNSLDTAGIPYYIAEVSTNTFALNPEPHIFQFTSDSYMFYKENLINMTVQRIPDKYTKLCFLDADILFAEPDWYTTISDTLDTADVCKPFQIATWLGVTFLPLMTRQGDQHPGFAWAVRRDWFAQRGIFDLCILGTGDLFFKISLSATTHTVENRWSYLGPAYAAFLQKGQLPSAVTAAPLTVVHLFHGIFRKRQYGTRDAIVSNIMSKYGFTSIESLVIRRDDGLLEWAPAFKEEMNAAFLKFFLDRDDDGI